nr:protein kinase-like domain-containing protein [Tanacetum cinerariifolium]
MARRLHGLHRTSEEDGVKRDLSTETLNLKVPIMGIRPVCLKIRGGNSDPDEEEEEAKVAKASEHMKLPTMKGETKRSIKKHKMKMEKRAVVAERRIAALQCSKMIKGIILSANDFKTL